MLEELQAALRQPYVHMASEEVVLGKVRKLHEDGPHKLLVLSDFDMTLSKYYVNGRRGYTSYAVIENSTIMPESYRQKAWALKQKYAPVEVSKDMSLEEKVRAMDEWWALMHQLLVEYKVNKDTIGQMVSQANIGLRSGCEQLFSQCEEADVPLLIFSAGLADTIIESLRQQSSIRPNMTVISNRFTFDDSGVSCGFSEPVIHSYNKGQSAQQFAAVFEEVKDRKNVILIGDSMGDPKMIGGLQSVDCVLRIGFLNVKEEELLSTYLQLYDVVLTGDASMDVVCAILTAAM